MGRRTSALTAALLCSACETDPRAEYPGQAAFESASSIVYVDDRGVYRRISDPFDGGSESLGNVFDSLVNPIDVWPLPGTSRALLDVRHFDRRDKGVPELLVFEIDGAERTLINDGTAIPELLQVMGAAWHEGNPYLLLQVAYNENGAACLALATRLSGAWEYECLPPAPTFLVPEVGMPDIGGLSLLAVEGDGRIVVAGQWYAFVKRLGGAWELLLTDPPGWYSTGTPLTTDVVLDSAGRAVFFGSGESADDFGTVAILRTAVVGTTLTVELIGRVPGDFPGPLFIEDTPRVASADAGAVAVMTRDCDENMRCPGHVYVLRAETGWQVEDLGVTDDTYQSYEGFDAIGDPPRVLNGSVHLVVHDRLADGSWTESARFDIGRVGDPPGGCAAGESRSIGGGALALAGFAALAIAARRSRGASSR